MIQIRKSKDRCHLDHGWLNTYHTFSFGQYYDPQFMGFRVLRVINEDRVAASNGFPPHSHNNMEILSYVLEGSLGHKDSTGTGSIIHAGEIQSMSAGSGIQHSEFNPSEVEPVHFFQIWIIPEKKQIKPGYDQKKFEEKAKNNRWCLIASHDGREGSVVVHQDIKLFTSLLAKGNELEYTFSEDRYGWLQVAKGQVKLNNESLSQGDGASLSNEKTILICAEEDSEIFFFDLP